MLTFIPKETLSNISFYNKETSISLWEEIKKAIQNKILWVNPNFTQQRKPKPEKNDWPISGNKVWEEGREFNNEEWENFCKEYNKIKDPVKVDFGVCDNFPLSSEGWREVLKVNPEVYLPKEFVSITYWDGARCDEDLDNSHNRIWQARKNGQNVIIDERTQRVHIDIGWPECLMKKQRILEAEAIKKSKKARIREQIKKLQRELEVI